MDNISGEKHQVGNACLKKLTSVLFRGSFYLTECEVLCFSTGLMVNTGKGNKQRNEAVVITSDLCLNERLRMLLPVRRRSWKI